MQSAEVQEYRIDAVLHMSSTGSENEAIQAEATRRLAAWINLRRRLGVEISRSAIDAHPHSLADRGAPQRAQRTGWQGQPVNGQHRAHRRAGRRLDPGCRSGKAIPAPAGFAVAE